MPESANLLYYGDNLEVLRRHVKDESVDLVYLDPPFNSNANYNVLFAAKDGHQAAAQIEAFEDTWTWDENAARQFAETVEQSGPVADVLLAFERFIPASDMLAYLAMMAPRLIELRRALKPTGALYLHCDPTASHYLKLLLDAVFGPERFLNEIVWERTSSHNFRTTGYVRVNDTILYYTKGDAFTFNQQFTAYGEAQLKRFKLDDVGRLYKAENLTFSSANATRQFEWRGTKPPSNRSWGASREQLEAWLAEGRILLKKDGTPRLDGLKVYLDDTKGKPLTTNWTDIQRIGNTSGERLGYQTQKPLALLERIIAASSNEGDIVLDPFCGCGTTIEAAQKLNRKWIGIDVTSLATALIKRRLRDAFGDMARYKIIGEPTTAEDAEALAESDKYQFQYWALGLVGARPATQDQKKGADKGIDGRLYFHDGGEQTRQIIFSVKGGKLKADDVRALDAVVRREGADIGVLLSFEAATKPMRTDAASMGFYDSPWGKHPRLQLLTVAELLAGASVDYPKTAGVNQTYKQAHRQLKKVAEQRDAFHPDPDSEE